MGYGGSGTEDCKTSASESSFCFEAVMHGSYCETRTWRSPRQECQFGSKEQDLGLGICLGLGVSVLRSLDVQLTDSVRHSLEKLPSRHSLPHPRKGSFQGH